jgi:hypothetical protein
LAACSSSPPATKPIPTPSLGVDLDAAQKFFNGMGGGGWRVGALIGGVIGYASGDESGYHCDVQLGGRVSALNRVFVACMSGGPSSATPQQAAQVFNATVHRFVPGATRWAQETTAGMVANAPSGNSGHHKIVNSTSVEIQGSSEAAQLVIEPESTAKAQTSSP